MLGFKTFASSPFASVGGGAIVNKSAKVIGEAIMSASASTIWSGDVFILSEAEVNVFGDIAGSGWVRQNPNTDEWDYDKSSDWNKIK